MERIVSFFQNSFINYSLTEYYITNHLVSIRATIDGTTGEVIGYDDYYPFGQAMPGRSYNGGTPNDLNKFTGHERDTEGNLNLDYMLARNYDPEIGRFLSVDLHAFEYPHFTPYGYTLNNPIKYHWCPETAIKK